MSKTLGAMLGKLLHPSAPPKKDTQRKAREQAVALATEHGIEIERLRGGGFNVWPPKDFVGEDAYEGDHYASDWQEALVHVRAYVPT